MKTFNAIQMVILLMVAPTLLSLCKTAEFPGAPAIFWVGTIGTLVLAVTSIVFVREGIDKAG